MKKILLILWMTLLIVSPSRADQKATTESGEEVILRDDGTWELMVIKEVLIDSTESQPREFVADGFRGFGWGTPTSVIERAFDLYPLTASGTLDVYEIDIDMVGGATITLCLFSFFQDQFASVTLECEGYVDWDNLLAACKAVYGPPSQKNKYIEEYTWFSNNTIRILKYNRFSKTTNLLMASPFLYDAAEKQKAIDAESAIDDF